MLKELFPNLDLELTCGSCFLAFAIGAGIALSVIF